MNALHSRICTLAALASLSAAVPAHAGVAPESSAALASVESTVIASPAAPSFQVTHAPVPSAQFLGVHYRPRRSGEWDRSMESDLATELHFGFFDPEGAPDRQFLVGMRAGPMLDPHVQLGFAMDWSHRVANQSYVRQSRSVNGFTQTVHRDSASASTNLVPLLAFVQFSGPDDMPVIPYMGLAGGYEVLRLTADDYKTHESFSAFYSGWGWQAWAGAAIPLSGQVRVSGELSLNVAEPTREVREGDSWYRESVNASGVGMHLGLAWGF